MSTDIRLIPTAEWMPAKLAAAVTKWNREAERLNGERQRAQGALEELRRAAMEGDASLLETLGDKRAALAQALLAATVAAVKHAETRQALAAPINEAHRAEKARRVAVLDERVREIQTGLEKLRVTSRFTPGIVAESCAAERAALQLDPPAVTTDGDRATVAALRSAVAGMI